METRHFELIVEKHSKQPNDMLNNGDYLRLAAKNTMIAAVHLNGNWPDEKKEDLKKALNYHLGNTLFFLTRLALDNGTTIEELMRGEFQDLAEKSSILKSNYTK